MLLVVAVAGCIVKQIEPTNRHSTPQTDLLRSELSAHTRSLAELDGIRAVKYMELSTGN